MVERDDTTVAKILFCGSLEALIVPLVPLEQQDESCLLLGCEAASDDGKFGGKKDEDAKQSERTHFR